jgi:DNA-binding MarR family transcriptional regulator
MVDKPGQDSVVALVRDLTAKLSAVAEEFASRADQVEPDAVTAVSGTVDRVAIARGITERRRLRRRFLPEDLFHEPAWDMLLALYVAQAEDRVMNVKTLVAAADAPVTTSQRWIDHLAKLRLVDRVTDPVDRRRIEVSLSIAGHEAIENYLAALGPSERPIG